MSEPDDDDWECAYPGECLMAFTLEHMRSECVTLADAEAYAEKEEPAEDEEALWIDASRHQL